VPSIWLLDMGCLGTVLCLAMLKVFVYAELRSVFQINSVDLSGRRCSSRPATRKLDMAKGTAGCRHKHLGHGVGGICHVLF
jgi:hypothetical protein